jgi:hypothetical protein
VTHSPEPDPKPSVRIPPEGEAEDRVLRYRLRKYSATIDAEDEELAEAGVAEATLKALVGHVSVRMLEHYSHIRVQAKRDAVQLLEPGPPQQ